MGRLYVVAFPHLSSGQARRIEALRSAHDPDGHALLKAHFTFVFGAVGIPTEAVEAAMRSAAAAVPVIRFRIARPTYATHDGLHYVFLCPDEGAAEMCDLHARLHAGPLADHLDAHERFTPHLTIGKTTLRAQAMSLCRELERDGIEAEGMVRSLSLGVAENNAFTVVAQVPLLHAT